MKLKVFIDTNIWLAGYTGSQLCRDLVDYVEQRHAAVASEKVLAEMARNLKKKFHAPDSFLTECANATRETAEIVEDPADWPSHCRDPKDDPLLEDAIRADCDWIVSGDRDLCDMKRVRRIPVTTPRDFMEALGVEEVV